jgi:hypothetical protein
VRVPSVTNRSKVGGAPPSSSSWWWQKVAIIPFEHVVPFSCRILCVKRRVPRHFVIVVLGGKLVTPSLDVLGATCCLPSFMFIWQWRASECYCKQRDWEERALIFIFDSRERWSQCIIMRRDDGVMMLRPRARQLLIYTWWQVIIVDLTSDALMCTHVQYFCLDVLPVWCVTLLWHAWQAC